MSTELKTMTDAETSADLDAVIRHVTDGTAIDPELSRRVRERSEKLSEQIRRRYGQLEVAVDLVREGRDEP